MKTYFVFFLLIVSQIAFSQNKKRIYFKPTTYYSVFSSELKPVLNISPGDTIYTESIDAEGIDKHGKKVTDRNGGNPLTGPFYINGAEEGDILVITLIDVSLNRPSASSFESFVPRSLPEDIVNQFKDQYKPFDWDLDLKKMTGSPKLKQGHLKNFYINLHPFLGDVGIAPKDSAITTDDAGPYAGNLDFNRLTTGSKLYVPVFHKGALLLLGDGHAAQGDGEINLAALETSMNFAFTVQLIKNPKIKPDFPRLEDATYIMAVGLHPSLDSALKIATKGLLDWVQQDYQLSLEEATQVIGSSIEYRIPEIADPKVEVVAMIKKAILKRLAKTPER
ncbi:MAG: acetamidase/formamidase family protein [Chitinophagaceae bacterium]|nr:acetamidase/formamidase family protein [Chitinophagaceae bacterium]